MFGTPRRSSLALALLGATMLTPPGPARAAPGDSLGREFQVNSHATDEQRSPAVAMDADGDFVVAWESFGQDGFFWGIFAQRFDAAGLAQGEEFQVNSHTTFSQTRPAVAMDAQGDFVVVWEDDDQDGSPSSVFARRYDAAGAPQGGEFPVNSLTTGGQRAPSVAMDADAWSGNGAGDNLGVFARRYNAAGVAQGPEFRVNSFITGSQGVPSVAMDADGDFVVAWESYSYGGQDGSDHGVYAQRFDAAGAAQGPEFRVNTFTTGSQFRPSVAMDTDGDFVVAWESGGDQDGEGWGVFAQRYNAEGVVQGPEVQVNASTTGQQRFASVAMDADGDFVVAWQGTSEVAYYYYYSVYDVFARRYDAEGAAQGPEVRVNTFVGTDQDAPSVAMDADGDFVVGWESQGQDDYDPYYGGYTDGIFAQRYDGVERVEGDFNGDGNGDVLWRNTSTGNALVWLLDGPEILAAQSIGAPPLVWEIAGTGDFNGDGKTDLLWRNSGNGAMLIWQMDGFDVAASGSIGAVPTVWEIEAVRDANGDGLSDIVWRNGTTGATIVWLMNGFTRVFAGSAGAVPDVWEVH
jgi:hypothetical protein